MNNQGPFIITQIRQNYFVPPESTSYNLIIEKRIQLVQGANLFLAVMLSYDSIQHGFQVYQYYEKCQSYAWMIFALLTGNLFWIACSIFGFYSIDAKDSQKIHRIFLDITLGFIYQITCIWIYGLYNELIQILSLIRISYQRYCL